MLELIKVDMVDDEQRIEAYKNLIAQWPTSLFKSLALEKLTASTHETSQKTFYLGVGTYVLLKNKEFIEKTIDAMREGMRYGPWLEQLHPSNYAAISFGKELIQRCEKVLEQVVRDSAGAIRGNSSASDAALPSSTAASSSLAAAPNLPV